ncbi:MAG: phosphorylated CTD interacting factor 1, WW domain [Hyperionvirus sp.]|uniref:Phosphorylated CTD interacting factor 1, WW domain n=1 Tax=Hyperionvirus sp. TaxID=2487770 RepID=A0A3G5A6F8_9VIRU|nr:MAG: phosphorylated CTD interacting factor 1, WW domain [Hyperionvirus sp.]
MSESYYSKYLKYKKKYLILKNAEGGNPEEKHNMFYYLNQFKHRVIDLAKNSYCDPKLVSRYTIEGMFMKWYLNSLKGGYIPNDMSHVRSDFDYQWKRLTCNKSPDRIISEINGEVAKLKDKAKLFSDHYTYKPIFSDLQLQLLRKKYTGPPADFEKHRNFLSELYSFMGGFNNHMSVPPKLIADDCIELFGTPVNTKNKYCSPFPIEKQYFSSYGSFFDYELTSGFHIANPPFDEEIMLRMANRLINQLSKQSNIDIVIIIPKWKDLEAYNVMAKSKYLIKSKVLTKASEVFFSYYDKKYAPIVDCYCIQFSNYATKFSLDEFISKWSKIKYSGV